MMIKSLFQILLPFLFLLIFGSHLLNAQQVVINEEESISDLMEKYTTWEKEETKVNGWRIQIINTDDRRKMEKALSDFRHYFPNVSYTKWKQVSPYYKVIIGAYDSKLDVLAFLQDIKKHFPSAIPVIEKIDEKEVLNL